MQRALDFDKTPALRVPLPFLLNVPAFGMLAGLLVIWAGPAAFASRWNPATLALTHLWTLGILGSAMLGALLQILAVACNVPVVRIRALATTVYVLFTTGTLALAAGFLWWLRAAWLLAGALLGAAFFLYLAAAGWSLWRFRAQVYRGAREILVLVRAALVALALTVLAGLALAGALAGSQAPPPWVGAHLLWGLAGWGGLLLAGMSFQLLPVFQATELFPAMLIRWMPLAVTALLLAWTLATLMPGVPAVLAQGFELLTAATYALWAAIVLQRLRRRKHPQPETTTRFWQTAMVSVLAAVLAWLAFTAYHTAGTALVLGILLILGVLASAINGMVYKILPFLLWKHAQDSAIIPRDNPAQARAWVKALPRMATYIPDSAARLQWFAWLATLSIWVLAGAGLVWAAYLAGPLLLVSSGLLGRNFMRALLHYRRALRAVADLARTQQEARVRAAQAP